MKTGRPATSALSQKPYRMVGLLQRHGILQSELREKLRYASGPLQGQSLATSTLSQLLRRREWRYTLDKDVVKADTAAFLRARGVPEEEIQTAWDVDGELAHDEPADHGPRSPAHYRSGDHLRTKPTPDEPDFVLPETEMLSAAAREHFNIVRHPFVNDIEGPQDVYLSKDQRYIRESMYQAVKHAGFLAVVGESGSGKSTLRRDLVDRLKRENDPIVLLQPQAIDKQRLTTAHICDAIIADLSTEAPKRSLEAKARQVTRILTDSARSGNSHALMIEEAHDLTVPTLKYLKRFWELEDGFKKLLGVVLVGQPELGDMLDERRNYAAREVIRRCEVARLKPLNGNLEEYLGVKFKRVGLSLFDIVEKPAFDALRARLTRKRPGSSDVESQLYPLVVQNALTKCMNQAAELGLPKVTAELVGRV
jgi:type II secretory pathway predicted ATPase ExeA